MASRLFIRALIRRAKKEADPEAFLEALATAQFNVISTDGGKLLESSSVDGASFKWSIPSGLSTVEIIEAAELALLNLEYGTRPVNKTKAFFT